MTIGYTVKDNVIYLFLDEPSELDVLVCMDLTDDPRWITYREFAENSKLTSSYKIHVNLMLGACFSK